MQLWYLRRPLWIQISEFRVQSSDVVEILADFFDQRGTGGRCSVGTPYMASAPPLHPRGMMKAQSAEFKFQMRWKSLRISSIKGATAAVAL